MHTFRAIGFAFILTVTPLQGADVVFREGLAINSIGRATRSVVRVDAVESQIVAGTWRHPAAGDEQSLPDGTRRKWELINANNDGLFQGPLLRGGYVAMRFESDRDQAMILDAAGHSLVYVNGELHTGDPYSNGIVRVPLSIRKGDNQFLFLSGRGQLRAKLIEPRAAVQFDLADMTLPDVIVGRPIQHWGAVPVLNSDNRPLNDAVIEATLADGAKHVTPIGPVLPKTVRKVSFQISGAAISEAGETTLQVRIVRGEQNEVLDSAQLKLRVVSSLQTQKRTFVSDIDGSVQYFGIVPAMSAESSETPALILTLHGAGVEAIGQANAYLQKDWAHVVAPTNRRPYGFDWEDWGRLDAIEVLEMVQKELRIEPGRTFLTGHSMGGHGVWQMGAHFPDRFAAIGPSAGWVSFTSYGGRRRNSDSTDATTDVLTRAGLPSNTLALSRNYLQHGVYVLHGEVDDNVPVREARTMKSELEKMHPDFAYHEEPGMGHWWGKEGVPGTACVDWPPMWEFFRKHTPQTEPPRSIEFLTSSPNVSASSHWVSIEAQTKSLTLSSVNIRRESPEHGSTVFRCFAATSNVERLALDLHAFPWAQSVAAELDGVKMPQTQIGADRRVWFSRDRVSPVWSVAARPSAQLKGPRRGGPFKDAFARRMIFVYGTSGTVDENAWSLAKARYDAETFWYRGNGSIDCVPDSEYERQYHQFADRSVILYGNANTNSAWNVLLADSPIQAGRAYVRVGEVEHSGDDLACLFVRPHPKSDLASVAVICGSGAVGQRLADRIPIFNSGSGIPDFLVLNSMSLVTGLQGVLAAGFFGADWSLTDPNVMAGSPTLLGISGVSVNGRVHSRGLPTTWFVEYGDTTEYGQKTQPQPVPPKLGAFYRESWDEGWNGWNSWCPKRLHFATGGFQNGYIRYAGSPRDDHNHDDGVGTVHLTPYMYPGSVSLSAGAPSAYLAGGDPDLRDAVVKQAVRGDNWKPNGSELIWWSQAQSNIEANPDDHTLAPNYKHPNWSYTGKQLTDLLATGRWELAEYRLLNDTNLWSYCGNNKGEQRYDAYWSIDQTQRHLNLDLFHMLMFVDPANRPSGAIDFDEFEVRYHNYSLAYPSNGGRLLEWPRDGQDDPANLTDGWRHGEGKSWRSAANPSRPLEFVYEFAVPVTIEKVQLHQHPQWPAKDVEVLVSDDGSRWQPIVRGELPQRHPHGANYNFLLKKQLAARAKLAKVQIRSGYRSEHWGLGEIELFGTGAAYTPDDAWFHVNVDLVGLKPGQTIHYRFVATNSQGTVVGADNQAKLPLDTKPHLITGPASRIASGSAKVEGRLNPLGKATKFYFEFGTTKEYGQKTPQRYGGLQITPRLVFDTISGLIAGQLYHYRLVAENETGTSYGADATFEAR